MARCCDVCMAGILGVGWAELVVVLTLCLVLVPVVVCVAAARVGDQPPAPGQVWVLVVG